MTSSRLNRRTILAGGVAAAVTAAGTSAKASPQEDSLADIIQRHECAWQNLEDAGLRLDICDEAFSPGRTLVPLAIHEDGSYSSGMMELGKYDEATIRERIEETHEGLFRIHCSKWSKVALPGFADAMNRTIEASLKRTHEAFDAILADAEKQERESGLIEAREKYHAASGAEVEARIDLILYRPKTKAEANTKNSYIEVSTPFADNWAKSERQFMPALLAKTAEVMA